MKFELLPILDKMAELYQKPLSIERFKEYLQLLTGGIDNDLETPIVAFNPMAKEHVLQRLNELRNLNAEHLASETISTLNSQISRLKNDRIFKVVLSLADDLKGGWTNRYTSDYQNKFKINALVKRNFCTPVFWTSELFDEEKIKRRTLSACHRCLYWQEHPKPLTLEEHALQETRVARNVQVKQHKKIDFQQLSAFYQTHKKSEDYLTIFNFFYGDEAMASLGNKPMGISDAFGGYEFAMKISEKYYEM